MISKSLSCDRDGCFKTNTAVESSTTCTESIAARELPEMLSE